MDVQTLQERRFRILQDVRRRLDAPDVLRNGLSAGADAEIKSLEREARGLEDLIRENRRGDAWERYLGALRVKRDGPTATSAYRGAWLRSICSPHDLDAAEKRALSAGIDTAGGYRVSTELEARVQDYLDEVVDMRKYGTVSTTTSTDKSVTVTSDNGSASWVAEGGTISDSDPTYSQRLFTPNKLARLIKFSVELHDDVADLESQLGRRIGRSFAIAESTAFLTGNGTGRPKGLTLDCTIGKTATSTTAVGTDELLDLYFSVASEYRNRGTWLMSTATHLAISKLKDAGSAYVLRLAESPTRDTLMARPIVVCSDMPAMAANALSIAFGDLSFYHIVNWAGVYTTVLRELYAVQGQRAILSYKRTDAKLLIASAVKTLKMAAA
jgi:HK97 family phage major capsid protein